VPVLLAKLFAWIVKLYTFFKKSGLERYGFMLTGFTLIAAAFAVVKVLLVGLISGLTLAAPTIVPLVLSWVMPYNLDECVAARLSLEAGLVVYRWKDRVISSVHGTAMTYGQHPYWPK